MIVSFRDEATRSFYETGKTSRFSAFARVAERKLIQMEAAVLLRDLSVPPGNRLEALKGNRAGQHSIRINQQYRICFRWTELGPDDVEICDYHD